MSVGAMRNAFNLAAAGQLICQQALMDYVRRPDDNGTVREYQILTFRGMWRDGTAFEVQSEPLLGEISVGNEAAAVAMKMLAPQVKQLEGPTP